MAIKIFLTDGYLEADLSLNGRLGLSLFDNMMIDFQFSVYHDETSDISSDEDWFGHGFLLVPKEYKSIICDHILELRVKHDYYDRIHFVKVRKPSGKKFDIVSELIKDYFNEYYKYTFFTGFAVRKDSDSFLKRFNDEPYLAYNRFAHSGLLSAFRYRFYKTIFSTIIIEILSEKRPHKAGDNYTKYLPRSFLREFAYRTSKKKDIAPVIKVQREVCELDMKALKGNYENLDLRDKYNFDLMCLTDVIISGIGQVFNRTSLKPGKLELGNLIAEEFIKINARDRNRQFAFLRKYFDIWGFPDKNGRIFDSLLPFVELIIPEVKQMALPF